MVAKMVAGLKEEELGRFSRKTVWWWYVNQCHFPVWTCPRMQLHFCGGESMCLLEGLNNSHHSLGGTQNRLVLILCTEAVGPSHCSRPQRLALRASLSNNDRPKTRSSLSIYWSGHHDKEAIWPPVLASIGCLLPWWRVISNLTESNYLKIK